MAQIQDTDDKLNENTNWQLETVQTLHKVKDLLKDCRDLLTQIRDK